MSVILPERIAGRPVVRCRVGETCICPYPDCRTYLGLPWSAPDVRLLTRCVGCARPFYAIQTHQEPR